MVNVVVTYNVRSTYVHVFMLTWEKGPTLADQLTREETRQRDASDDNLDLVSRFRHDGFLSGRVSQKFSRKVSRKNPLG